MTPHVLLAVTSRDGRLPWEVGQRCLAACRHAADNDVQAHFYLHVNHYAVHLGRNEVVQYFLQGEYTHLLFVDDDVLIPRETIPKLLAGGAVAGGVYPYRRDIEGVPAVVLSAKVHGEWRPLPFHGIERADCVGAGCMMVDRQLFTTLGFPWFRWPQWLDDDGTLRQQSDDLDFCLRASKAGALVTADGDVRCGHLKEVDLWERMQEVAHADH